MYKYFPYKELDHREILQYGILFIVSFILFLAVLRDIFVLPSQVNLITNTLTFFSTFIAYYFLHVKKFKTFSAYLILAIGVLPLFFLIYVNHFGNLPILYVIILPLGTFFMLPFKQAMVLNIFIYTAFLILVYVIYKEHPDLPIFHNIPALFNFVFVSMMTMLFGIFYHLSVESFITELIRSNKEKEILLNEVHHRVKNNLNVTSSMLGLQALQENDEIKSHILKSKSRIEAIATVHEMLYKQESHDRIHVYDYLVRLEKLLFDIYNAEDLYQFEVDIDKSCSLPLDTMVPFGLIFNEMFTNTLKYASNLDGVKIKASIQQNPDYIEFIYKDNGLKEVSQEELSQGQGLGLKLIKLSAKQIDAGISIFYDHGLTYILRMKNA